jgi:hypothetical protein
MRLRGIALVGLLMILVLLGANGKHRLEDRWRDPGFEDYQFTHLLIIGVTDDRQARRNFENQFVSHLRGRGIEAVTSYSLVPELTRVEDETALLDKLAELEIDGAITVRVTSLKGTNETEWGEAWRQWAESDSKIRNLIEDSLPVTERKSGKYGVEVALWTAGDWNRIWAARTNPYTRKQMQNGSAELVQFVMTGMNWDNLLD